MSDARREVLADTLMDCRASWPWEGPSMESTLTYQEAMRKLADILIRELDKSAAPSPALTREALAAALHDRYGAGLCISAQDLHGWEECQAGSQWTDDADAILAALGTPPPAPTEEERA